jgi:hypothetical protein
MGNNFDLKKFLVENKLTPASQKVDEYFSFNDKSPEGQRAKNKPSDVLGRRGQGQITPDNKDAYKNVVDKKGDMGKYYGNVGPKGSLPEDLTDPFPRFQGSTMKEFVKWAVPIFKANNVAKEDYIDWFHQIDDDGGVSDYRGATEKELMDVHFGAWYPEYGSGMPTDEPYADKIKNTRYESLSEMEDEEDLDEVDGGPFEYNWGKGVKIGGTNPSSLTFYFDNKLNKLIYTYKNTRGVLSNNDLKQLHDFLSQYI